MKTEDRTRRTAIIIGISLAFAVAVNLAMLSLLGQNSPYRAAHSLAGIIVLMGFTYSLKTVITSRLKLVLLFVVSLLPCYLGTVFPDLDIRLLGIGGHRNPLFHSGIPFFILMISFRWKSPVVLRVLIAAFGVGIASHLLWDVFDHADVRWIPGGALDRAWLVIHGMLCLVIARLILTLRIGKLSR